MGSHYICPFRYHLGLCIKKFTKNALTLATQKSPLEFSLSFSHTHFGLPKGFNWNFPPIVTVTFLWESTRPPGFCMFHLPFVSSQSTQWVMLTVAKENPRRPVLNESPGQPLFEKLCVIKNRLNVFFFFLMSFFTQGNNRYEDWKFENECNILDVLQDFPSVQVSADLLLTQLPLLQPVRKSITQHITSAQQHQEFCS